MNVYSKEMVRDMPGILANSSLYILLLTDHHSTPEQAELIFQSIAVSQPVGR